MNPTRSRRGRGGRSTNRSSSPPRRKSGGRHNFRGRRKGGRPSGGGQNRHHSHARGGSRSRHGGQSRSGGRKRATFDPTRFINANPAQEVQGSYKPTHTFKTFGLTERLTKIIDSMGFATPTPIQDQIIPSVLNGRDVIGLAETGTGKTAAFLLPIIEKTLKQPSNQTIVLTPTRELAIQIDDELRELSRGFNIHSVVCVGGVNIQPQIRALQRRNSFVIGTPGRVLDLLNRKKMRPEGFTTVVLDEADRMLDMGFIGDMRKILSGTPKNRQTLFFSATMSETIKKLVHDFLRDPIMVSVKRRDVIDSIEQDIVKHGHHDKFETLVDLLKKPEFKRVLIFGSMKHSVEKLSRQISKQGIKAESIHGNKSHGQRQRALGKFKKGEARVLVATDVAARGIHVDDITHVINYDLPNTMDDYIHRIGRTGRVSKRGKALTFVQG